MKSLTEKEKAELKLKLISHLESFIEEVTLEDNNLGYLPDEIFTLMANASLAVLYAAQETNVYMKREDLLK